MAQQKISIGRIVRYVAEDEHISGAVRPAMVTAVDGETCNLTVFMDPPGDGPAYTITPLKRALNVRHDEESKGPGTWHWPPRD